MNCNACHKPAIISNARFGSLCANCNELTKHPILFITQVAHYNKQAFKKYADKLSTNEVKK